MGKNQKDLLLYLKQEIKEYGKLFQRKKGKYTSLADMKHQQSERIATYSDEDLDFLYELIKLEKFQADKATSGFLPVWAAVCIALLSFIDDKNALIIIGGAFLIIVLLFVEYFYNSGVKRLGFYSMMSEIIEKVWEKRGHNHLTTI